MALKRSDVDEKYKWDLSEFFSSDEDWENAFAIAAKKISAVEKFRGTISSAESLYNVLEAKFEIIRLVEPLHAYAMLEGDCDMGVSKYQSMKQRVKSMASEFGAVFSFLEPEILQLSDAQIVGFFREKKELAVYKRHIELITRMRAHTLSDPEEKLLAHASMLNSSGQIFSVLENADMKFGKIKDEKGIESELTLSNYDVFIRSKDRRVRESAYMGLKTKYIGLRNTFGTLRNSSLNAFIFNSKARKYENSLQGALFSEEMDRKVYDNLISSVNDNVGILHDYIRFKAKRLGLEKLKPWDVTIPSFDEPEKKYTFEESFQHVKKADAVMGEEYVSGLERLVKRRHVDVYPTERKRSGGYQAGIYGYDPFILLNYEGTVDDIFTLAHELGHSMHSIYSNPQPMPYADYTVFCAETASTTNEQLLLEHLLSEEEEIRPFLLDEFVRGFNGKVFTQTKFAEFEEITHRRVEQGEQLGADAFSEIWGGLERKYLGNGVEEVIEPISWSMIPHFYHDFYVYTYATGMVAGLAISKNILEEGESAAKDYIDNFLKAGSSKPSLEIMQSAGVDLTSKEPFRKAFGVIEDALKELEKSS